LPVVSHSLQSGEKKKCHMWRPYPSICLWLSSSLQKVVEQVLV